MKLSEFADAGLADMQKSLGAAWDSLTPQQKASLARAMTRKMELTVKEQLGEDVAFQKRFVETTIDEFKMAGEMMIYNAFNAGAKKALDLLAQFVGKAGQVALKGLLA